jgi:hypothetical protein
VPLVFERLKRRLVWPGSVPRPLSHTTSIVSPASGANASALHWCSMLLSMTTTEEKPDAQVAPVSAFVDRQRTCRFANHGVGGGKRAATTTHERAADNR